MKRDERRRKVQFYRELYDATTIGLSVVFSILIGGILGWWLDREYTSSHHWLFFLFLFFGIVAAFRNMFYGIKKQKNDNTNNKKT